jgi:hypothetical protein
MAMTHAQGMAYELARELISSKIGNVSHELGIEELRIDRDDTRIDEFQAELIAYARERESLDPADTEAVGSVIIRYSRTRALPDILGE